MERQRVGHEPDTVRTDEGDPALLRDLQDLAFERSALGSDLGEAGSENHGGANAPIAALLEHPFDLLPAHGHQSQVGRDRQLSERRVGGDAEERPAPGIHGIDGPLVTAVDEVAEGRSAPFANVVGGPDDGDR